MTSYFHSEFNWPLQIQEKKIKAYLLNLKIWHFPRLCLMELTNYLIWKETKQRAFFNNFLYVSSQPFLRSHILVHRTRWQIHTRNFTFLLLCVLQKHIINYVSYLSYPPIVRPKPLFRFRFDKPPGTS